MPIILLQFIEAVISITFPSVFKNHGQSIKGMFLYSTVSSQLDRSKRFTLFLP